MKKKNKIQAQYQGDHNVLLVSLIGLLLMQILVLVVTTEILKVKVGLGFAEGSRPLYLASLWIVLFFPLFAAKRKNSIGSVKMRSILLVLIFFALVMLLAMVLSLFGLLSFN